MIKITDEILEQIENILDKVGIGMESASTKSNINRDGIKVLFLKIFTIENNTIIFSPEGIETQGNSVYAKEHDTIVPFCKSEAAGKIMEILGWNYILKLREVLQEELESILNVEKIIFKDLNNKILYHGQTDKIRYVEVIHENGEVVIVSKGFKLNYWNAAVREVVFNALDWYVEDDKEGTDET